MCKAGVFAYVVDMRVHVLRPPGYFATADFLVLLSAILAFGAARSASLQLGLFDRS